MGGHGHGPPYVIPPYTEFKVEGIQQLETLERALARKGLKDPWIRNEAWRYHPGFGTKMSRAKALFCRGMPLGIGLTIVSLVAKKAFGSDEHHGHDEHH